MRNALEMRAATVISANEFAMALSDEAPEVKKKIGIQDLDMPTLTTAVADAARGQKILTELGYSGAYYVKTYNDTQYVIIKGLPSLRAYLRGTRYLANNPQVVRVGLGPIATNSALKANFVLAMTMYTAVDIAALVVSDDMTFPKLMGNMIFNGTSIAVSSLASAMVTAGITSITAMAAPAILGGIIVGVGVSMLLNNLNAEFKISEALAAFMERVADAFTSNDIPPSKGIASDCPMPSVANEAVDLEECVKKKGLGKGTGGGPAAGNDGNAGGGDHPGGGYVDPVDPHHFDDSDSDSSVDDNEDYHGDGGGDGYAGKDDDQGFSVGYKDAESGDWVVGPESEDYEEVVTGARGGEGGSN